MTSSIARCALAIVAAGALATPALAQGRGKAPAKVTVTNARTVALSTLEIATSGEQPRLVGKLAKPLAPGKSTTLSLTKPGGCSFYVLARFDDGVETDSEDVDLCRDAKLRLTE